MILAQEFVFFLLSSSSSILLNQLMKFKYILFESCLDFFFNDVKVGLSATLQPVSDDFFFKLPPCI